MSHHKLEGQAINCDDVTVVSPFSFVSRVDQSPSLFAYEKGPNMSTRLRHAICQNDGGDGASPKGRCVLTQPASTDVTSVSHSTKDSTSDALLSLPKTKSKATQAHKYYPIILVKFIPLCCCIHNASAGSRDLELMPERFTSFLINSRKWYSYGN